MFLLMAGFLVFIGMTEKFDLKKIEKNFMLELHKKKTGEISLTLS